MPLALESQGRVRQKAREIIKQPGIFFTLKEAFLYLSIYKKNSDLQLVPFDAAGVTGASGQLLMDAPATVYIVWAARTNTGTASYLKLFDDAANDATAADQRAVLPFNGTTLVTNQILFSPEGLPMAAGVVAASHTGSDTQVQSAAADAASGFVILGA